MFKVKVGKFPLQIVVGHRPAVFKVCLLSGDLRTERREES